MSAADQPTESFYILELSRLRELLRQASEELTRLTEETSAKTFRIRELEAQLAQRNERILGLEHAYNRAKGKAAAIARSQGEPPA